MNNEYSSVISNYVKRMKSELNNELSLLLVIGSSCSSKVIIGWSDIDVILVIRNYNFKIVDKIKNISKDFPVKIGTTIYSEKEFISKKIDPKTYYHLYLLKNKKIELQYVKENFPIPDISFEEIKNTHVPYLNWRMHIYKRYFLYDNLNKEQVKALYKMTYLIMKAILILGGYTPKNYDEVFKTYSKEFNFDYLDYEKFIYDYLNDNYEYRNIIEYAKKFLMKIIDN